MAWIESHDNLGDHPKLSELCFALKIEKHEAVGHLTLLWHFTLKYAWRDGDLRRFTPRVICDAVGWDKDHDTFFNALRETGWLDKDSFVIHDWNHYAGKLLKDRLYNEERRKTASNGVGRRKTVATLPYPTVPNQKIKTLVHPTPMRDRGFDAFWEAYPKKVGKGAAEKAWAKIPNAKALSEKIIDAVNRQKTTQQWLKDGGQFIPHPATWLNQKRWEDQIEARQTEWVG